MIVLTKGQANTNIALTLAEKTTLSNPTYLFVFQSDNTLTEYTVIATETTASGQSDRINLFSITEGVDDRENGSVILGSTGTYHYFIYEQSSTTNLDPSTLTESDIVERGFMRLIDNEADSYVYNVIDVQYQVNG